MSEVDTAGCTVDVGVEGGDFAAGEQRRDDAQALLEFRRPCGPWRRRARGFAARLVDAGSDHVRRPVGIVSGRQVESSPTTKPSVSWSGQAGRAAPR